jgi:hypothetical protein
MDTAKETSCPITKTGVHYKKNKIEDVGHQFYGKNNLLKEEEILSRPEVQEEALQNRVKQRFDLRRFHLERTNL